MSFLVRSLVSVCVVAIAGCPSSRTCGGSEECNYRDDDCDGRVDEGFIDGQGLYTNAQNCGTCGIDCEQSFENASSVSCVVEEGKTPFCRIDACAEGYRPGGAGTCLPNAAALCLPCDGDAECDARLAGAVCRPLSDGSKRCTEPCGPNGECQNGFTCEAGQCTPTSGVCACTADTATASFACIVRRDADGRACAGAQRCGASGLGVCEPLLQETCNEADDDCDGAVDEDFKNASGKYLSAQNCGSCGMPCVAPGANVMATCAERGSDVACTTRCREGYVDVDGLSVNGCECQRYVASGPPPVGRGDSNCDGVVDDSSSYVFVSSGGSDESPGTLDHPLASIQAALTKAQGTGRPVLVARGIYRGPVTLVGGVDIYGGYSPDFSDRNLELYPVLVERAPSEAGLPALICQQVTARTRVDGVTFSAVDATQAGRGSTTAFFDRCGAGVELSQVTLFAARGAAGARGIDSSARLADWGVGSLADLTGVAGREGNVGTPDGSQCLPIAAGTGGRLTCRRGAAVNDVSGGSGGAAQCAETGCSNGQPCANAGCTDFTVNGVCDIARVLRLAVANPAAEPGRGVNGGLAGERTYNSPTDRATCTFCDDNPTLRRTADNGRDGALGADGVAGVGCAIDATVDFSTSLVAAASGGSGGHGEDGSGGGGASAGAGYDVIAGTDPGCADHAGGSGGGGGSGGCGAPGATGGGGGGASVAVLIRLRGNEGPTFDGVRIVTASGGAGGDGGIGASGGAGGSGGNGGSSQHWCARNGARGGDGGRGGSGGGGGGGCGGGSHGVFVVTAGVDATSYRDAIVAKTTIEQIGVSGRGGAGGFSPARAGQDGLRGKGDAVVLSP